MRRAWTTLARPVLHRIDAEWAHGLTLHALAHAPLPAARPDDARLAVAAFGLVFPNPVGLAAGFDKNALAPDAVLKLGFGHVEIGTVTPRPQPGNPRPRLFRLLEDEAVINRFGFNSAGHMAVHRRLAARRRKGLIGVNIGANKEALDRAADYVAGIRAFIDVAAYFTVNVSSPNTPGLRELQKRDALDDLLARVMAARDKGAEDQGRKPILLKIAPDLTLGELDAVIEVARARKVDGLIVSNTTLARPEFLGDRLLAREAGGLSGRPLFVLSTRMLAHAFLRVEGQFPLIGVGGIDSAAAALAKLEAGASLVQLYSSLVFKGPRLIADIKQGILQSLDAGTYPRLADATGASSADWASGKLAAIATR